MSALADLLRASRETVVFTGAGVSTLSGIPDFRGPQGLYKKPGAEKLFDLDTFRRAPAAFYRQSADFIYGLEDHEPALIHRECARLERLGLISTLVTQNIDMLHQRAGSRSVIEVHGSPRRHTCLDCGAGHDFARIRDLVRRGECPACDACGGVVKPDIVFFGEGLDADALGNAMAAAAGAGLMLVLGSSLVVHPAAGIPLQTVKCGGKLAIVNAGPTPLDEWAEYRAEDLETCFAELADAIPA